jgi:hypothetical protein
MEAKVKLLDGMLTFSRPCSGVVTIKINDITATLTDEELIKALRELSIKGVRHEDN